VYRSTSKGIDARWPVTTCVCVGDSDLALLMMMMMMCRNKNGRRKRRLLPSAAETITRTTSRRMTKTSLANDSDASKAVTALHTNVLHMSHALINQLVEIVPLLLLYRARSIYKRLFIHQNTRSSLSFSLILTHSHSCCACIALTQVQQQSITFACA
jgi:DNA-binding transcriptional regulator YdaS (Cro superfamily)